MNERILELAYEAGCHRHKYCDPKHPDLEGFIINQETLEKFAELIKQAIWNDVKEELMEDEIINIVTDPFAREYLKGCNGGTVDALYRIKQFGIES